MTSQENKPREFWIWNNWSGENDACMYIYGMAIDQMSGINPDDKIHVIEYSAFEQLKKENEELRSNNNVFQDIKERLINQIDNVQFFESKLKFITHEHQRIYTIFNNKIIEQCEQNQKLTQALNKAEETLLQVNKDIDTYNIMHMSYVDETLAEIKKIKGE